MYRPATRDQVRTRFPGHLSTTGANVVTETVTLTLANANDTSTVERSVPRRLGPVVLECEIGRGAMGVVFRGRHEILGRNVAVKLLLHALRGEEDPHFDRFRGEARMAAAVRHPNLTMIHHADVVDGIPYLVMDYIDGPQLSTLLKQFGPLPIEAALAAALAMTDAVAALHGSGIVHRDIKTKNTLLDRDGQVFVTDFGLALARAGPGASITPSGVVGTPAYMAPEMFDGLVSPRSDVYALGITTFELMTGSPPFSGSLAEVREQHVGSPLSVAALEVLGVTPAIIDVLERATHKNATFRYKSADYYRQALEAVTDETQRAAGRAALKDLAARFVAVETPPSVDPPTSRTPTTTYFDLIGQIADQKRMRAVQQAGLEQVRLSQTGELSSSGGDVQQADVSNGFKVGTLRVDLPCVKCRYNLRGLDVATRCPECGQPISNSTGPPRLAFSDPKWLARVQRGLTMLLVTAALSLVVWKLLFLMFHSLVWSATGGVVTHMLWMVGLFLATTRDASVPEGRRLTLCRRAARVGAFLAVGTTGLHYVQSLGSSEFNTFNWVTAVGYVGGLASGAGLFFWLAHLATRNLDTRRARNARIAVVPWTCLVLAFPLLVLVQLITSRLIENATAEGFRLLTGVVATVWAWIVRFSFRRLVKQERRLALALCAPVGKSSVAVASTAAKAQEHAASRDPATARPDGPDDPRRILHLQRCPQCDYDLRTLPARHRCPECGFEYDPSMFALYGCTRTERLSVIVQLLGRTWAGRLLGVLIIMYVVCVTAVRAYERWVTISRMSNIVFICGVALISTIYAFGRRNLMIWYSTRIREQYWGTVQLLFTTAGASKRRGPGEPRFVPWERFRRLRFRRLRSLRAGKRLWRLRLTVPFFRWFRWEQFEALIECTPREAALVRGEIRRRLRAAQR